MHKEHFVCIILCEICILTLLCHTYIGCQHVSTRVGFLFLHFVCIILCGIFIVTLLCPTYIFLHFVCIILCEIFILTLLYHTNIGCQQVSTLVGFLFHHCCLIPTFFCTLFVSSFVRFSLLQCLSHGVS